jgi:hypothetical protein
MTDPIVRTILEARGRLARTNRKKPHAVLSLAEVERLAEVRPRTEGGLARVIGTQRAGWYGRSLLAALARATKDQALTAGPRVSPAGGKLSVDRESSQVAR